MTTPATSHIGDIKIAEFDYPLPDERIAKHPLADRDQCLMLVGNRAAGTLADARFFQLPDFIGRDTLLVCNDTRVINARLRFTKGPDSTGAAIEIFCLEPESPRDYAQNFASDGPVEWLCFVGNSKRWKQGVLELPLPTLGVTLQAERVARQGNASVVCFSWQKPGLTWAEVIAAAGEIPIPPYLNRHTEASDSADYQTVFSHFDGSVAAPTAGLHFTPELLGRFDSRRVTLHVGAGTFQPVKSETIGEHLMHAEFISVTRSLIEELAQTERPVLAVGTTSVRTLESLYHIGTLMAEGTFTGELPQWAPYRPGANDLSRQEALQAILRHLDAEGADRLVATTRLMIAPGYRFRMVDHIVTNFHQPSSTLLLLVSAFLGEQLPWRRLYDHALANPDYRFLSYGDACLLL